MARPVHLTTPRPATILDVAAAAGVSRQTVTRAMNAMPGISDSTRQRVLAAAKQLNYRPSRFGRGLVTGGHRTLGLVVGDLLNPYYPELASAMNTSAAAAGWNVVLAETTHAPDRRQLLADLAHQVDALVGYVGLEPAVQREILGGLPVIEIDRDRRQAGRAVVLDRRPAIRDAVRYLVEMGVRRPVMMDNSSSSQPSSRARAFITEMQRYGLETQVIRVSIDTLDAGIEGVSAMLALVPDVDAVMTYNDVVAFGVLQALPASGRRVPEDVKVIGIDGVRIGALVTPALTTIAVDLAAVAQSAVDLLTGISDGTSAAGGQPANRAVRHRHRLVIRAST